MQLHASQRNLLSGQWGLSETSYLIGSNTWVKLWKTCSWSCVCISSQAWSKREETQDVYFSYTFLLVQTCVLFLFMPLHVLSAFSKSWHVNYWWNSPLLTFPVRCFAWCCRRKFCRTSQGLRDLYYSGANLSLMRALLFSLERTQMSPKNWVFTAVSQGKHWFQICSQHRRTFIFVGGWVNTIIWCVVVLGREKGGKKQWGG